jgi:NodT family efflux transporter outer membrane factor (OMF) lipoprotein
MMQHDQKQEQTISSRQKPRTGAFATLRLVSAIALAVSVVGCTKLGPDYVRPQTKVQQEWVNNQDSKLRTEQPADDGRWWKVFNDPVLDRLIELAYQENLTLETAGLRILESRAQLGIAVGGLYPQLQQATANATATSGSRNDANTGAADLHFSNYNLGLTAGWELDFWGRYARGIESADAGLLASVASYDDILTSLTATVASTYLTLRSLEERIAIARANIKLQKRGLELARVRYRNGLTTELDVNQAETLLSSTQASETSLTLALHQAVNALSTLLGKMPAETYPHVPPIEEFSLDDIAVEGAGFLPKPPIEVAVGIPADLLRRRPDVRLAEMQAWAQSARIGLTQADLYPSITLFGTIGFSTGERTNTTRFGRSNFGDLLDSDSVFFSGGPGITWNVFNYGRIKNNVRVQDARLQQALTSYQNAVLKAGQEVEDAMSGFLLSQQSEVFLSKGAAASKRSVDIAFIQYEDGATDFNRVLDTMRSLLTQENQLTVARTNTANYLVNMYRSLGGGWQIREGNDFVSEESKTQMRERTDWGGLLDPAAVQDIPAPDKARDELDGPDW